MRIAVISDSHNRIPHELPALLAKADEIWHLGDVCAPEIIDELQTIGRPLHVVRGNCDQCSDWPFTLDFTRGGLRIRLVHIPPREVPAETDLILHGHTHVPRNEKIGAATFLNPGCLTRPNRGAPRSFAWLTIEPGKPFGWDLRVLD